MSDLISRQAAIDTLEERLQANGYSDVKLVSELNRSVGYIMRLPSEQPESTRTFVELVVEYPDSELCTYKEYKGKPYYSIKYIENGETYVGYGTYNPKVLSQYLKEYFISSAQSEQTCEYWDNESKFCVLRRPSAQAEIVRCNDCKYCYAEGFVNERNVCEKHYDFGNVDDDWFCADGERR